MAARHPGDRTAEPRLTTAQTRIEIPQTTRRWHTGPVDLTGALDFWSFAGAAANVIQQLGRPEVAYGVMESKVRSGSLMAHPWKRARTTLQYLAVAILGTDDERAAFRDAVNSVHRHVRSDENSPVAYNAFNRDLQMYVAACLFIGFEDSHQLLYGQFTPAQAEHFYQSASGLGTTLQVREEQWPATRADFDRYWNAACERVVIDERTREYLMDLVRLRMINWPMRVMFGPLLQFLTVGFLPPLFREQLGLEWGATDRRRFENLFVFVSLVNRLIPRPIRGGATHAMMADVRRRLRAGKNLV